MALSKYDNWLIRLTQVAGFITSLTLPMAYAVQRWLDNCSPATIAYFVLPHCEFPTRDNGHLNFAWESVSKLVIICIWSSWLLLDMIGFFCFVVFEMSLLPGFCFRYYMKFFCKVVLRRFKHGQQNQIREQRNCVFPIYRQIQILSRYHNLIHQDAIVIGILDIVLLAFIICCYALISNGSEISIPHLFLFSSGLLNGFLGICICFGCFGKVYGDSVEVIAFLRSKILNRVAAKDKKFMRRYVLSLQPIKVRVGNVLFVDNMTPIVLLHFCFSQIVNLLMI